MKRIIRLNEESLKRLIKEAFEDLTMDYDRNGFEKARYLGRTNDDSNNQDLAFGEPKDDRKKELEQLISKILNFKKIRGREDSRQLEGRYFFVDLEINIWGGHYIGELTIRMNKFATLVSIDLDLTTFTIIHQEIRHFNGDYAEEVNSWTSSILKGLGYRQNG